MKIVSNVLENIEGIQIFYNIGVLIFFSFFLTVVYRTYFMTSNKEAEDIKNSIFDNDETNLSDSKNLKL